MEREAKKNRGGKEGSMHVHQVSSSGIAAAQEREEERKTERES